MAESALGYPLGRVVVVGAGLAGLRTSEALRRAGYEGMLTIVGEERHPPYNRPPLTKGALAQGPQLSDVVLPSVMEVDATWLLGRRVTSLDADAKRIELLTGESMDFDGLVIATGVSARRLPPDVGDDADVHYLRTLDDAVELHRALAARSLRVLVLGAGFLGSEIASTAAAAGHRVTLVEMSDGPMLTSLGEVLSTYCDRLHRDHGVDLRTSTVLLRLARDGRAGAPAFVAEIGRHHGRDRETVRVDVVVAALGAVPATGWLRGSGLALDDGVLTNGCLTALDATGSPVPGVVAVGDVARVPQPLLDGLPTRVEHWATAVEHSRTAAATLAAGCTEEHRALPSFWSDQHGARIRGIGLPGLADSTTVIDGSVADGRFVVACRLRDRVVGVVAVNNAPALMRYRPLLDPGVSSPVLTPT